MITFKKLLIAIALISMPSILAMEPLPNQEVNTDALKYARELGFEVTEEIAALLDSNDCAKWDQNWADVMADVAVDHEGVSKLRHEYAVSGQLNPYHQTLLAIIASSGDERCCRIWIAAGADPNHNPPGATTPLIEAARNGHESVCRILLEAGAEVDAEGIEGTTALIGAVRAGHELVCKVLVQAGANFNRRQANEDSSVRSIPMVQAVLQGNVALCKLFIDAGADVNSDAFKDLWDQKSLLGLAITDSKNNNEALARMLLLAGAHVAATDRHNRTALMLAAELKNESMCQLLVDANNGIKIVLGCLRRLKTERNIIGQVLYTHRDLLLLPYLNYKQYVPTKRLLCMRENLLWGKHRAYDHLPIECLNPMFGYNFPYDPSDSLVDALVRCAGVEDDEEKKIIIGVAKCAQSDCSLSYYGFKPKGRDAFLIYLPALASERQIFACELLVHRQQRVNNETFTALLCMNRLRKNNIGGAGLLYQKFRKMLFPHLYREFSYVPLVKLLHEITDGGKLFTDIKCLQLQGRNK